MKNYVTTILLNVNSFLQNAIEVLFPQRTKLSCELFYTKLLPARES